ncbi:MAG TPA: hypothetical protein VMZ71_00485 [Gemmataceae bacterium]|nr:hypothetical protein [Gemmataceae bacterium]
MATAPSPNELTRQQLDELDALLQRMLALPLNPPDTPSTPAQPVPVAPEPLGHFPRSRGSGGLGNGRGVGDEQVTVPEPPPALPTVAPNWRVDPPAAPAPHMLLAAAPLPLPDPVLPPPAPEPAPVAAKPEREPEPVVPTPAPVRVVAPRLSDEPAAPPPPKPDLPPLPPQLTTAIAPPTPWALVPLVAVNRLTDAVLGVLGPVGKVLRSGFGRNLFGVAGVLLIAYTAARVAQVQGWVTLPFPLPWPK